MWKPRAEPLASLLGLEPTLAAQLIWQLVSCVVALASVAMTSALLLATCGFSLVSALGGACFVALCTLNLMRLVHACAGLGTMLVWRPALVPVALLFVVACTLSQAVCAAALDDELSLAGAWQQHPVLACGMTLLVFGTIAAPGILRLLSPAAARSFEQAQRALIERRVAAQRDTCAELCDSLLAYELDRLDALRPEN
jgi:hypothetical protein